MNNKLIYLFEKCKNTKMVFGTRRSPNAIQFNDAVIIKRNFKGEDIKVSSKGKTFVKKGRRFTLVLDEDTFKALTEQKGECAYGIWSDPENPDVKVYTIEVKVNMASQNPPSCKLYTKSNGRAKITALTDTNLSILDEIWDQDIERVELLVNPYDPDKSGHFSLWLKEIKISQIEIEDTDSYWKSFEPDEEDIPFGADPNID